jgi:hypothetical protein
MTNISETMAPGWYPDPAGRHESRYWDGARWTEQIADAGVAGSDPGGLTPPSPAGPTAGGGGSRTGIMVVVVIVAALAAIAIGAFFVLQGGDGGGGGGGGPLAGPYQVSGTNFDGSAYEGTVEITGDGPGYRVAWEVGSTTSSGEGTLDGDRFVVDFSGAATGAGTAAYRLEDDGSLVGTWTLEGSVGEGTETLTPS